MSDETWNDLNERHQKEKYDLLERQRYEMAQTGRLHTTGEDLKKQDENHKIEKDDFITRQQRVDDLAKRQKHEQINSEQLNTIMKREGAFFDRAGMGRDVAEENAKLSDEERAKNVLNKLKLEKEERERTLAQLNSLESSKSKDKGVSY